MSKLNFKKPSGESRLTETAKKEIIVGEMQRITFDFPKELARKLKVKAALEGITMREIVIDALNKIII